MHIMTPFLIDTLGVVGSDSMMDGLKSSTTESTTGFRGLLQLMCFLRFLCLKLFKIPVCVEKYSVRDRD